MRCSLSAGFCRRALHSSQDRESRQPTLERQVQTAPVFQRQISKIHVYVNPRSSSPHCSRVNHVFLFSGGCRLPGEASGGPRADTLGGRDPNPLLQAEPLRMHERERNGGVMKHMFAVRFLVRSFKTPCNILSGRSVFVMRMR